MSIRTIHLETAHRAHTIVIIFNIIFTYRNDSVRLISIVFLVKKIYTRIYIFDNGRPCISFFLPFVCRTHPGPKDRARFHSRIDHDRSCLDDKLYRLFLFAIHRDSGLIELLLSSENPCSAVFQRISSIARP